MQRSQYGEAKRTLRIFSILAQDRVSEKYWIFEQGKKLYQDFLSHALTEEARLLASNIKRVYNIEVGVQHFSSNHLADRTCE